MGLDEIRPPLAKSWTQTTKGTWTRSFTAWDKAFVAFLKHDPMYQAEGLLIISSTKIALKEHWSQSELGERLRQAWQTMRYYFPMHGFENDFESAQITYKTPSAQELEKWTNETFEVREHASAQDVFREASNGPKMVFCPHTGEITYIISHLLSDALGVVNFWQRFYEAVETPEQVTFGDESKYLAPTAEELIGCPTEASPELEAMAGSFMGRSMADMMGGVEFKHQTSHLPATKTHSMCFTYNQATTSNIVKSCKSQGWSVTAAVSAAMAAALFARKDLRDPEASVLLTNSAHNYQQYLKPDLVKAYPQVNTATILPMSIHKGSFHDMATECNTFYRRGFVFDDVNLMQCTSPYMTGLIQMTKIPRQELKDAPCISSLGLIDGKLSTEFKNFNIRDFRLGVTFTLPGIILHVWTFAGELCVNFSWMESWTEEERVYSYAEEVRNALLDGLHVKEE